MCVAYLCDSRNSTHANTGKRIFYGTKYDIIMLRSDVVSFSYKTYNIDKNQYDIVSNNEFTFVFTSWTTLQYYFFFFISQINSRRSFVEYNDQTNSSIR